MDHSYKIKSKYQELEDNRAKLVEQNEILAQEVSLLKVNHPLNILFCNLSSQSQVFLGQLQQKEIQQHNEALQVHSCNFVLVRPYDCAF